MAAGWKRLTEAREPNCPAGAGFVFRYGGDHSKTLVFE
jgi:hypothetical protein